MPRLHVCSLALIAETVDKTGARSLLTLLSPGTDGRAANSDPSGAASLSRRFRHRRTNGGSLLPEAAHLDELLAFVRAWDRESPLLIYCFAGVSRSTAAAYIAACALAPERDEFAIARALRAASPTASPNARLVALADDALGQHSRMNEAIAEIRRGQECLRGRAVHLGAELSDPLLVQPFTAFAIASCSGCVGEPKNAGSLSLPPSAP